MKFEFEFHPLANLFPLIEGEEFDELVADIKERGVREPIVLYEDRIIDGRNRYRAAQAAGIELASWQFRNLPGPKDDDWLRAYVIGANIKRRHLTTDQRKEITKELLKANPEKSDRSVAKETRLHHETVAAVRKDGEASGEIRHIPPTDRVDAGGRKRARKTANEAAEAETAEEQDEALKLRKRPSAEQARKAPAATAASPAAKSASLRRDEWVTEFDRQLARDLDGTLEAVGKMIEGHRGQIKALSAVRRAHLLHPIMQALCDRDFPIGQLKTLLEDIDIVTATTSNNAAVKTAIAPEDGMAAAASSTPTPSLVDMATPAAA